VKLCSFLFLLVSVSDQAGKPCHILICPSLLFLFCSACAGYLTKQVKFHCILFVSVSILFLLVPVLLCCIFICLFPCLVCSCLCRYPTKQVNLVTSSFVHLSCFCSVLLVLVIQPSRSSFIVFCLSPYPFSSCLCQYCFVVFSFVYFLALSVPACVGIQPSRSVLLFNCTCSLSPAPPVIASHSAPF